ncbi:MAG: copper chaperone [Deltaproteobacteria bacterium]|nr:copper chaperone [Deltaproteobacteria bacterium]TLN01579.1 MAG: heavy-metal-associated domain-containing protein [bacterium]
MNVKRISTLLFVIAAVTVLVVFALRVGSGATADSIAVLQTKDMTCGSCSSKITRALESLSGVVSTEVDVNGGWVLVGYDTKAVKPELLAEKVMSAGFRSTVHLVLTPEQFKQISGRDIGAKAAQLSGCCGGNGGCGTKKQG